MRTKRYLISCLLMFSLFISCEKDDNIDVEKPVIDLSLTGAFPKSCDTLYFGEPFNFKALFTDNAELGSFSIGIHHNFDHHSHSTEVSDCTLDAIKNPINPNAYIEDFSIPEGLKEYETDVTISMPSGNNDGIYDEGDYHFFISLTDKEGWSTPQGLSIKMLHR